MTNKKSVAVELTGVLRWASIPPNQPQKVYEPKPGQENNTHYSIEVECSRELLFDLLDKGIPQTHKLNKDEETGITFLRVKCPKVSGGYLGKDPEVLDNDGNIVTVPLANGSEGTVSANIEFFTSKGGKEVSALRFYKVVVSKLIPYVREEPNPNEGLESSDQDLAGVEDEFGF